MKGSQKYLIVFGIAAAVVYFFIKIRSEKVAKERMSQTEPTANEGQ